MLLKKISLRIGHAAFFQCNFLFINTTDNYQAENNSPWKFEEYLNKYNDSNLILTLRPANL